MRDDNAQLSARTNPINVMGQAGSTMLELSDWQNGPRAVLKSISWEPVGVRIAVPRAENMSVSYGSVRRAQV
jgi:hypothetical protein